MNRILSTLALICLIAFLGVFIYRVPRLDLGIVLGLTILMACFDFWREVWRRYLGRPFRKKA